MKRRGRAGSSIGGIRETQEMQDFGARHDCARHDIAADVEVILVREIDNAYERRLKNGVRYRFVINLASLKSGAP